MRPLAPVLAAAALLAAPAIPAQEDDTGVLRLFDEFVSSGAAASRCAAPDDEVAARFLSNFQWVSTHATLQMGRQLPNSSNDEVAGEMAKRSKAVRDETHALVKAEGCEAPRVLELVRRFVIQASWVRQG